MHFAAALIHRPGFSGKDGWNVHDKPCSKWGNFTHRMHCCHALRVEVNFANLKE